MSAKNQLEGLLKEGYLIPELEIRVTPSWIRLIRWVQLNITTGQVCVKLHNFQPTELIIEHTKRRIRFDKEEVFPVGFEPTEF